MLRKALWMSVAGFFVMAPPALAGDYHTGASLICADCHVMHYSQTHGYSDDGTGAYLPVGPDGPHAYLLRDEETRLCLACHDGQAWAPDVLEEGTGPTVRNAGALNDVSSAGPYHPAGGHTLGSTEVAPGGTFSNPDGLGCTDCHHQHGRSDGYRNLQPIPTLVTRAVSTNDLTKDVFERAAAAYDIVDVDYNEPDPTNSKMGQWCMNCHTDFHGNASALNMRDQGHDPGTGWLRHPTADANIGAVGGGHSRLTNFSGKAYRTKVMSATGDWGTQGSTWPTAPADLTPSCFSCHKGHGNKHAFGLIFMTGTNPPGEEGDGTQSKDTCKQCHSQG